MIIEYHLKHGSRTNSPDRVVIHAMGENIEGEPDLWAPAFLDKIGLSAHILVTPEGNLIRCRHDSEGAWHAKGHNNNTLGIEFLVKGVHTYGSFMEAIKAPYLTDAQYEAGLNQMREWYDIHDIKESVAHSELSPGRKFDPGRGFPLELFLQEI